MGWRSYKRFGYLQMTSFHDVVLAARAAHSWMMPQMFGQPNLLASIACNYATESLTLASVSPCCIDIASNRLSSCFRPLPYSLECSDRMYRIARCGRQASPSNVPTECSIMIKVLLDCTDRMFRSTVPPTNGSRYWLGFTLD